MSKFEHFPTISDSPIKLVQAQVIGLGKLNQLENSLVAFLAPIEVEDLENNLGDNGIYFPLIYPDSLANLYRIRLSNIESGHPIISDLLDYYSQYTGCKISHVSIVNHNDEIKGFISIETKDGWKGDVEVAITNTLYVAQKYDLDIYVDQRLLGEISIRGLSNNDTKNEVDEVASLVSDVCNYIVEGVLPSEVDEKELGEIRQNITDEDLNDLIQVAIEHERYEWADFLDSCKGEKSRENED